MPDMNSVEIETPPSLEDIKAFLQADRLAREQRATARIKQVLEEERCVMNPVLVIRSGNISGRIEITAVD